MPEDRLRIIKSRRFRYALLLTLCALYTIVVIRNAWVCDDAYITFRVVDNFIDGFGLTWNAGERVQVYTNPLWMFLMSGVYFFTREAFYSSIVLSIVISAATIFLFAVKAARTTYLAVLGIIAFSLSKAFVDYSASGLENPLSNLLALLFCLIFLRGQKEKPQTFLLSLVAACAALTRLDNLIVFALPLAFTLRQRRSWNAAGRMAFGFIPLIVWELFSLFYYGFPLPNTAYAKLNTGVGWMRLAEQGLYYIWNSLTVDPLTMGVIATAIIIPFAKATPRLRILAASILLYILYVIRIGGDFMSGRFLVLPFLLAVIVLARYQLTFGQRLRWWPALIVLIFGLLPSRSPVYTTATYGGADERSELGHGIVDERGWYFETSGLLNAGKHRIMPAHYYVAQALKHKGPFSARGTIGYYGYFAERRIYVLDIIGLADPFLARMPFDTSHTWRIGHIYRVVPEGYEETVLTGKNRITDSRLAQYYHILYPVIRGNLFTWRRLGNIVRLNLGSYDYLLEEWKKENGL